MPALDTPPPLWTSSRPAIIRPSAQDVHDYGMPREAGFPGITPMLGGAVKGDPQIEYVGVVNSASDTTTYTFSSASLGASLSVENYNILGVFGDRGNSTHINQTTVSVTVGGVTATLVAHDTSWNERVCAIYIVPKTASSANIVVTWPVTMLRCAVGVWTVADLNSTTPTATSFVRLANVTSTTINIAEKGFAVSVFMNKVYYGWLSPVGINRAFMPQTNLGNENASFGYAGVRGPVASAETGVTIGATSNNWLWQTVAAFR